MIFFFKICLIFSFIFKGRPKLIFTFSIQSLNSNAFVSLVFEFVVILYYFSILVIWHMTILLEWLYIHIIKAKKNIHIIIQNNNILTLFNLFFNLKLYYIIILLKKVVKRVYFFKESKNIIFLIVWIYFEHINNE